MNNRSQCGYNKKNGLSLALNDSIITSCVIGTQGLGVQYSTVKQFKSLTSIRL
jgi:hypothetical protein